MNRGVSVSGKGVEDAPKKPAYTAGDKANLVGVPGGRAAGLNLSQVVLTSNGVFEDGEFRYGFVIVSGESAGTRGIVPESSLVQIPATDVLIPDALAVRYALDKAVNDLVL